MEVSKVSQEDGKACAAALDLMQLVSKLIDALRLAGVPLQGPGVQQKEQAKMWLAYLAQKMAQDLRKQEQEKPMSVTKVGTPQKVGKSSKKKGK